MRVSNFCTTSHDLFLESKLYDHPSEYYAPATDSPRLLPVPLYQAEEGDLTIALADAKGSARTPSLRSSASRRRSNIFSREAPATPKNHRGRRVGLIPSSFLVRDQSSVLRSGRSVTGPFRPGFFSPVAPVSSTILSTTPQRMTALLASLGRQKSIVPVIPTGDRLDSSGPRKIASRQVNRSPFHYLPYCAPLFFQISQ